MARAWVVDHREIVRLGLTSAISRDAEVVGWSSTVDEARARVPYARVDVAIAPAESLAGSGLELARALRSTAPAARTLLLAAAPTKGLLLDAIDAGVAALLPDDATAGDISLAVRRLADGESLLDAVHLARLLDRLAPDPPWRVALAQLTDRQHEILELVVEGHSNREIATAIGLAEQTVKNNVSRIMDVVGVERRAQLAARHIRRRPG